jgi:polyisoprenoid-binding protein YceI
MVFETPTLIWSLGTFKPRKTISWRVIMKRMKRAIFAFLTGSLCLSQVAAGSPDSRQIDGAHSTLTVHVHKSGFLSAFGHNHEIQAPIQSGEVKESDNPSVDLRVDARKLQVLDPETSEGTRAQIQDTMQGTQVLDVDHFPEIHFQSTSVEPKGPGHWIVHGNLELHGKDHPIDVEVTREGETYRGSAGLKQTDFGIAPVSVAGGTVKVKDEVKIEFKVELMAGP